MLINKWNSKEQKYVPHSVPDHWKLPLYCFDMDEEINCVNCGETITYGDGYTSRRYQNKNGIGYCECAHCYFESFKGGYSG